MNHPAARADLIAALSDELSPVRPVRPGDGAALIIAATLAAAIGASLLFSFWRGIVSGDASPFFWITNGLLLLTGAASTGALVAGALPRVGARPNAPVWAAAMLGVLPLAALLQVLRSPPGHMHGDALFAEAGLHCLSWSLVAGLAVGAAAVLFLRRGAPVALARQGWLTGLAAGALGTLAYGVTCPLDGIAHLGLWHVLPIPIAALAGRIVVPPLIRW
jgi:hypothetical protein